MAYSLNHLIRAITAVECIFQLVSNLLRFDSSNYGCNCLASDEWHRFFPHAMTLYNFWMCGCLCGSGYVCVWRKHCVTSFCHHQSKSIQFPTVQDFHSFQSHALPYPFSLLCLSCLFSNDNHAWQKLSTAYARSYTEFISWTLGPLKCNQLQLLKHVDVNASR